MSYHLCDTNVWLALVLERHRHHQGAREWLDRIDAVDAVRFCRATQTSFVRLLTNAAVFRPFGLHPLTNAEAWATYDALTADGRITIEAIEPAALSSAWRRYSSRNAAAPKLWMDAYLAAFAAAGGATMVTSDRAFEQFEGLDLVVIA